MPSAIKENVDLYISRSWWCDKSALIPYILLLLLVLHEVKVHILNSQGNHDTNKHRDIAPRKSFCLPTLGPGPWSLAQASISQNEFDA